MVSLKNIKHLNSLTKKKYRNINKQFIVEGEKMVSELLNTSLSTDILFATEEWITNTDQKLLNQVKDIVEVKDNELKKISFLKTPNKVVAVCRQPEYNINIDKISSQLSIALDDIQDPGNLGTIIRIADWFGIENIFCSKNSVDVYNPKVVQATMGAVFRVKIHYVDLEELLTTLSSLNSFPIYGTLLDGDNIYEQSLSNNGVIIMGNESKGISENIIPFISDKLLIPNFGANKTSESLNISIATAITCSEFRKK